MDDVGIKKIQDKVKEIRKTAKTDIFPSDYKQIVIGLLKIVETALESCISINGRYEP